MATESKKSNKKRSNSYEAPLKIKGDFLEVFKVVKKNKEEKAKKSNKGKDL